MSTYNYDGDDFKNDIFDEDSLVIEVGLNETITTALVAVDSAELESEGQPTGLFVVTFTFESDLSSGEQTALDSLVANHEGTPPVKVKWLAASNLAIDQHQITDTDPSWTEIGISVTTPSFFTPNVSSCKGRVVGLVKSNGTGAKLRLREDSETPSGGFDIPDTEGEWEAMQWFSPDSPTEGTHAYTLEGQLPSSGATEVYVKGVAVSLLEFYV